MLIGLRDYAKLHGKSYESIYQKYVRNYFQTARKVGGQVLLDDSEPLPVYRIGSGEVFDNPNYVRLCETRKRGGENG